MHIPTAMGATYTRLLQTAQRSWARGATHSKSLHIQRCITISTALGRDLLSPNVRHLFGTGQASIILPLGPTPSLSLAPLLAQPCELSRFTTHGPHAFQTTAGFLGSVLAAVTKLRRCLAGHGLAEPRVHIGRGRTGQRVLRGRAPGGQGRVVGLRGDVGVGRGVRREGVTGGRRAGRCRLC
jgi:hypothetical protein